MEQEYYKKSLWCSNCKKNVEKRIPKGTRVSDYLKTDKRCPECGNETLVQMPKQWRPYVE